MHCARLPAGLQILRCDHALLSVTFCDGQQVGEANTLVSVSRYQQSDNTKRFARTLCSPKASDTTVCHQHDARAKKEEGVPSCTGVKKSSADASSSCKGRYSEAESHPAL